MEYESEAMGSAMGWVALAIFGVSFFLSVAGTALARAWAPRLGLIDRPASRKVHRVPTPLGGGVALWAAVVLTLGGAYAAADVVRAGIVSDAWLPSDVLVHLPGMASVGSIVWLILGAGTVQMLMGLADDRWGLSYPLRLAVEVLLVALLIWRGVHVTLFPPLAHYWTSAVITVLWVVGLTNAFNFLDNMDGLSAGVACISSALFFLVMTQIGALFVAALLLVLIGALAGFLVFNWSPASIFMGDAGSNFIGFMIGIVTVVSTFTKPGYPEITIAAPLCVLAVPLYDSLSVILIRLRQGRSPFHADKSHFSHRLVALGMTQQQAVLTIFLVTLATGLGALLLYHVKGLWAFVVLTQVGCLLGVVAVLEAAGRTPRE